MLLLMRMAQAISVLYVARKGLSHAFTVPVARAYHPSRTSLLAIVDDVTSEMKRAMKEKDLVTLQTVRLIRSAFGNAAIDLKTEKLSDDQAISVLKKLSKMRKESIKMYRDNGADDRADVEQLELDVIERWLPEEASEDTVREWVKEAIAEAGGKDMGKVMGALMKKHKSEVDGKVAQRIVKEELDKI